MKELKSMGCAGLSVSNRPAWNIKPVFELDLAARQNPNLKLDNMREREIEGLPMHYTLPRSNAIRLITKIFPRRKRWKHLMSVYARFFQLKMNKSFFGSFNLFFLILSRMRSQLRKDEAKISCFSIIFFGDILFIFHSLNRQGFTNIPVSKQLEKRFERKQTFS